MKHRIFFSGTEITDYISGYRIESKEDVLVYYINLLSGGFLNWSGQSRSEYNEKDGSLYLYLG